MSELIRLERNGNVFVLTMCADENRWNTTFVRRFNELLDEVEGSSGPATLITASENEKFFSNGLDLEWIQSSAEHAGGDRSVFGPEIMELFARLITFPIPTVAAVNGPGPSPLPTPYSAGSALLWFRRLYGTVPTAADNTRRDK